MGKITWKDESIRTLGEAYYNELVYIGHLSGTKDDLTALENLHINCALSGQKITEQQAVEALEYMGMGGREHLPAKVLSQGQRRRVALARLLVCKAKLWILDEPLAALDVSAIQLVKELLERHLKHDGMIVMTTHQNIDMTAASIEQLQLAWYVFLDSSARSIAGSTPSIRCVNDIIFLCNRCQSVSIKRRTGNEHVTYDGSRCSVGCSFAGVYVVAWEVVF